VVVSDMVWALRPQDNLILGIRGRKQPTGDVITSQSTEGQPS